MHFSVATAILGTVFLALSLAAEDPLVLAKQFYDAAEYDKVLALVGSGDAPELPVLLREYRALWLFALSHISWRATSSTAIEHEPPKA